LTSTLPKQKIVTYEELLFPGTKVSFPANLDAKILFHLSSLTKTGHMQAKCLYLHENKEYIGIIFSQDNEHWLKDVPPGTLIKAERIRPCTYPDYAGQYMGSTLCFNSQPNGIIPNILEPQNSEFYTSSLIELLRSAADQLEKLQTKTLETNQIKKEPIKIQVPVKLQYKRSDEWATIIKKIVTEIDRFTIKPFSGISLNAYIDASYTDWEEGDLEMLSSGPRWKIMVHSALMNLLDFNFIEKVPGTKKHYRLTQDSLADFF
jgi:hypothetical protein